MKVTQIPTEPVTVRPLSLANRLLIASIDAYGSHFFVERQLDNRCIAWIE